MHQQTKFALFLALAEASFAGFFTPLVAQEIIDTWGISHYLTDRGVAFQEAGSGVFSYFEKVVGVGDANGDAYSDLLFSTKDPCALSSDDPHAAVLFFGRPGLTGRVDLACNMPRTAVFRPRDPQLLTSMETGATGVGDINHDGFSDFIFAYTYFTTKPDELGPGRAFLVFGSATLEGNYFVEDIGDSVPGVTFWSSDPQEGGLGKSMANIGDFNGDGDVDFAIGASWSIHDDILAVGRVFILYGASELPSSLDVAQVGNTIPGTQIIGAHFTSADPYDPPTAGESIGYELIAAGDVNGDGISDFIARSVSTFSEKKFRGRNYLIRGSSNPPPIIDLMAIAEGSQIEGVSLIVKAGQGLNGGLEVSGVVDMNGDGTPDILCNVHGSSGEVGESGSWVDLQFGTSQWLPLIEVDDQRPASSVRFFPYPYETGSGLVGVPGGDLNLDGVPDLLLGDEIASPLRRNRAGEIFAVYGKRDFPSEVQLQDGYSALRVLGECESCRLNGPEPAGDFNGDGSPDFVAKNRGLAPDDLDDGVWSRAYLIYGSGGRPLSLKLDRIEPSFGPVEGGTTVEVVGTGFSGESKIYFGSTLADEVQVTSEYRLSARTPPGQAPGLVDVLVTNGGEDYRLDRGFEFIPKFPEIDLAHLGRQGLVLEGKREDNLGTMVSIGDVTGDGIDDLIVGKRPRSLAGIIAGVVKGGPHLREVIQAFQPGEMDLLIYSSLEQNSSNPIVTYLGDVNGDSIGDMAITQQDAVGFIVFGGQDLESEVNLDALIDSGGAVKVVPENSLTGGWRMIAAGDLTDDGIIDLALGFSQRSALSGPGPGQLLFIRGRSVWPKVVNLADPGEPFCRIVGAMPVQGFAAHIEPVGDVNGDGFPDILADVSSSPPGVFSVDPYKYLIYGSDNLPAFTDIFSLANSGSGVEILAPSNRCNISAAGDVNGDHFADILIGQEDGGIGNDGVTYLIYGAAQLPELIMLKEKPPTADGITRILGAGANRWAANIASAGDFNSDGFADFLIGETYSQVPEGNGASIFLMLGRQQMSEAIELGHLGSQGFRITRRDELTTIGALVGPFGDLNGDGQTDFAFAERPNVVDLQPAADESRLYVIYGPYGQKDFIRGDANSDGVVDISDAVTILAYLFTGGDKPTCIDAVDADDSGLLDITDAIYLLGFLFMGGPAPPAPYPLPGKDTTKDVYDCLGFNP
jgi:IPT/TIG domain-containing protein